MALKRIVDVSEVERWFADGWDYPAMAARYRSEYGVETAPWFWDIARRELGLPQPPLDFSALIPWDVAEGTGDWYATPAIMLRQEAKRRAGRPLSAHELAQLSAWKEHLEAVGEVVDYDPADGGWRYMPRRVGIDTDLIRVPSASGAVEP